MTLKEAILQRASVRKFKQLPIKSEELNNFMRGLKSIPGLMPGAELNFVVLTYEEAQRKYKNFSKVCTFAPYYLFFYGDDCRENWQNAGYLREIASLWLTCNNLGACFQRCDKLLPSAETVTVTEPVSAAPVTPAAPAASVSESASELDSEPETTLKTAATTATPAASAAEAETVSDAEKFAEDKRLPLILAIGHPDKYPGKCRKIAVRKRLISGSPAINAKVELLLHAACQAPSEYNTQPWRFWVTEDTIHIFSKPSFVFRNAWHKKAQAAAVGALVANLATLAELDGCNYRIFAETQAFADIRNLQYQLSVSWN